MTPQQAIERIRIILIKPTTDHLKLVRIEEVLKMVPDVDRRIRRSDYIPLHAGREGAGR